MKETLIVFDMDGTLVDVLKYHRDAIDKIVERFWGVKGDTPEFERSGKSQIEIIKHLCVIRGVKPAVVDRHISEAQHALTEEMAKTLPLDLRGHVLVGVYELLNLLKSMKVPLVLISGTIGPTAEIILARTGLSLYFKAFSFGDESVYREDLIRSVIDRASCTMAVNNNGLRVITIGDSPADIISGRNFGAYTVAVATGSHSVEDLRRYSPDLLFKDLSDAPTTCEVILDLGIGK